MEEPPRVRTAIRALMLTKAGEILLVRIREPKRGFELWITPGGAIEPGEDARDALRREVFEETGLSAAELGPTVWSRRHVFRWNDKRIDQREQYVLVPVERFEPTDDHLADQVERDTVVGYRWWEIGEIEASEELFVPRRLGHYLRSLREEGPPEQPLDVGA